MASLSSVLDGDGAESRKQARNGVPINRESVEGGDYDDAGASLEHPLQ